MQTSAPTGLAWRRVCTPWMLSFYLFTYLNGVLMTNDERWVKC